MTYEIALYPRHDQVRQAIDFGIGELPALSLIHISEPTRRS